MPPLPSCQLMRLLIAMHTCTEMKRHTQMCTPFMMKHTITHTNIISHRHAFPRSHFAEIVTDRAHKCQHWHSLSLLLDVCAPYTLQWLSVCVQATSVYIYTISFLRLCICVYSYICMCPCLSLSLSPCLFLAPRPPDSPAVLTLASLCAVGVGQILGREEMRDGINEGERGHRCQRRMRMRVWILSCREHMGVALCSRRKDKEWSRWEAKRAIVK